MTPPSPTIRSFVEFTHKLARAQRRIAEWEGKLPGELAVLNVRRQLEAAAGWTDGGMRPTDEELGRLNFGWVAAREIDPFDEQLSRDLSELSQYLHRWPAGAVAPTWP